MRLFLIALLATLISISSYGATSPHTLQSPYAKLRQAAELKSLGELALSERFTNEAISMFREEGYVFGQSEAYFFLGDLYKGQISWSQAYDDEFLSKSLLQFKRSKDGYISIGEKIQASKSTLELAMLQWARGDRVDSCNSVKDSMRLYVSGEGKHKDFIVLVPEHKTPIDLINSNIELFCSQKK
jgi:hypothetical protein